ncbi:bacteriophage antitermination protein Q [Sodalis sp. RH20]|uniref:bacteriophage antitermination protein Q n=1 Tax=unclassified Sodalis (in: enterobacteria) TaxID=2636512 RepID=UPI0039B673BD
MLNFDYIRERVSTALADIRTATKGQLAAFEDSPMTHSTRYKRKRPRVIELGDRRVCADTDPIYCPETRNRKQPFPPIDPITYSYSSWRRAIGELEPYQEAWIRYCYGYDLDYGHQVTICQFIWDEFQKQLVGKKVTEKMRGRLASLVWLAAQESAGHWDMFRNPYTSKRLSELVGVKPDNWSKNYRQHWNSLIVLCDELDISALGAILSKRSDARYRNLAS